MIDIKGMTLQSSPLCVHLFAMLPGSVVRERLVQKDMSYHGLF